MTASSRNSAWTWSSPPIGKAWQQSLPRKLDGGLKGRAWRLTGQVDFCLTQASVRIVVLFFGYSVCFAVVSVADVLDLIKVVTHQSKRLGKASNISP